MLYRTLVAITCLVASSASGAVLCKTRSGTLKLRDVCKASETQLDPAAAGLQGPDVLRLVGIVTNASTSLFTTSATFQDIPDTATQLETFRTSCVLAQFSALTRGDSGNVFVRALLDGAEMDPSPVRFAANPPGPGAFTFFHCGVPAGAHAVVIQFRSPNEGTEAVISERGLVVTEAMPRQ